MDRGIGHGQARGRMINTGKIELVMCAGELVIGERKLWIALGRLIQQPNGLKQALVGGRAKPRSDDKRFGPYVQIMSDKVSRWLFFDGRFLLWRKIDFKLRGNVCSNLGLQG